jgi:hypothetical protein
VTEVSLVTRAVHAMWPGSVRDWGAESTE